MHEMVILCASSCWEISWFSVRSSSTQLWQALPAAVPGLLLQCLSLIVRRPVQAFHHKHVQLNVNSTDAYTFLSISNFHSPINVNWRHTFCSHKFCDCWLLCLHWHICITFCQVYEHNSEASSSVSLKSSPTVGESFMNWMQFSLYS